MRRNIILKKSGLIIILTFFMGCFLFLFNIKQESIGSFKPYYAKADFKAQSYKIKEEFQNMRKPVQLNAIVGTDAVPVLLYHGILNKSDGESTTLNEFSDQMFAFKKAGYETIGLEDFYSFLDGDKKLPEKSFVLTFDDGRKDSYYPVDPILEALDYKAVMFVITESSLTEKTTFHLSVNELKQMARSGRWDLEVHTKGGHRMYSTGGAQNSGHFYTNKLWLSEIDRLETTNEYVSRVEKDLSEAKDDLSRALGQDAQSFAFPYGDYGQNSSPEIKKILLGLAQKEFKHGYFQANPGDGYLSNYFGQSDFLVKRIDVAPQTSGEELLRIFDSSQAKPLPYRDNFEKNDGWTEVWGKFHLENNAIVIASDETATGGSGFLDGASLWKNYVFQSLVDWSKGDNLILLARYKNDNNYVACNFYNHGVRVQQKLEGVPEQELNRIDKELKTQDSQLSVGIKVNGNSAQCLYNNEIILETDNLNPELGEGGIGFKSWSTDSLKPIEIRIHNIKVEL